ncbi:MAG: SMP-30/gluconolactonase/LRE family protein [Ramlibacter sp.]|nr:SMP-30/gluconolactonase/LRE family protein [Ramlibacter sp.]
MSADRWQVAVTQPDRLGESPFWHPLERMLYWVDIPAMQLRRCDVMAQGAVESWAMPSEPGCIAPAESGGLVIALRDGIYRTRSWRGELVRVAGFEFDPRTTRFNDGKADPLGRMWAGTMYEPKDAPNAKLYSVDCRPDNGNGGQPVIEQKAQGATTANGLAWSPDGKTVYWSDTPSHAIRAWDWDADSNAMRNERVFKQFPPKPDGWQPGDSGYGGRPDGASVDSQGNYWCAMYEGGRVLQISPVGEVLQDIPVPAMCPTMPCFGGPDRKTLFVTTAQDKRLKKELEKFPDSGCMFSMTVEVAGLPVNFFDD